MIQNKKVLIAVLNEGDMKVELASVLNDLTHQGKYDVQIIYPSHKPISNNRNKIVQEFLYSGFDYLMMIDDDIIPPKDILNLVDFEKDIISPVCFAFQQDMVMPLMLARTKEGDYGICDFKGHEGLVEVDAVGTGCLILSRKICEEIKAPFADVFDDDGIRKFGLDLAFCQRAQKSGYKILCHLDYSCSHKVIFDLKKIYNGLMSAYGGK